MKQLSMVVTDEFEKDLRILLKNRRFTTKTEAIKTVVHEASAASSSKRSAEFPSWLGIGLKAPLNTSPKFSSDEEIWS